MTDFPENLAILIIDDDEVDRMTVKRHLKSIIADGNIAEAINASDAWKKIEEKQFDCIFLDYLLPDSDGLTVLTKLRNEAQYTPVIMLTGHGDERLVVDIMRAGASDYIPKEKISRETLSHSLHAALRLSLAEKEKNLAEEKLLESNKRIFDILESISDAFFALDESYTITYLNKQAEKLLLAQRVKLLHNNIFDQLNNLPDWFKEAITAATNNKQVESCEGEYQKTGKWLEAQIYPGKEGVSVYFRDITSRKQIENRLNHLANYDALTELPNRVLLMDRITQALTRAPWNNRKGAIMFCDLDRFKVINDSLGHNIGDELLKQVAQRLLECTRSGDTVARLGGDEFVIVLTDMAKIEDINAVAQKIIENISQPMQLEQQEICITASIGISIFPEDSNTPDELLKHADTAMYRAKDRGKNCYQLYSNELDARVSTRLILESKLRHAIENDELQLYYQPQVDTLSGQVKGAEALLRWISPEMGLISPLDFLPLAEETGLIEPIGKWVLETACYQTKQWHMMGFDSLRIGVNLSNRQFCQPDLVAITETALENSGLPATHLELELTENIVMQNGGNTIDTMMSLRNLGVSLSVDDFGTGYSSLAALKKYPIQTVKIDRSFVKDIPNDKDDEAIVEAILAMAKKLKLYVIVEGVETQEQCQFLNQLKCDEIQGFFFSRPIPTAEFTEYLVNNSNAN